MSVSVSNHGLSVLTGADASQRLTRPITAAATTVVTNSFSDATSRVLYANEAGHNGIDFGAAETDEVRAMYEGVVIEVVDNWTSGDYGNYVKIASCTNPEMRSGFTHVYAHLSSVSVALGQPVSRDQRLGFAGKTGTEDVHLHVHLRPFGTNGTVPPERDDAFLIEVGDRPEGVARLADRVDGCMNFACFLPFDTREVVNGQRHVPAPIDSNLDEKMLSPRDAAGLRTQPGLDCIGSTGAGPGRERGPGAAGGGHTACGDLPCIELKASAGLALHHAVRNSFAQRRRC